MPLTAERPDSAHEDPIYRSIDDSRYAGEAADGFNEGRPRRDRPEPFQPVGRRPDPVRGPSASVRHWTVMCHRNLDVLIHNRLTLAIMLGAPALIVAMFLILFRSGAFDTAGGDALAAVGITYWLAFAGFFFGLTYGLLQICTEAAVVRRERHVGLGLGA